MWRLISVFPAQRIPSRFFVLQYCELSEISIVHGNRNVFDSELTMLLKEMWNFFCLSP